MAIMSQLRCSSLSKPYNLPSNHLFSERTSRFPATSLPFHFSSNTSFPQNPSLSLLQTTARNPNFVGKIELPDNVGNGGSGNRCGSGGGGGAGDGSWSHGGGEEGDSDNKSSSSASGLGVLGFLIKGWESRVAADPQFPFKVLMEEVVGVSSSSLGDMASRPNFGLNELDFVFSGLVVCSIVNFVLMYLLAPTMSSSALNLPAIFASCPKSHMFEPGAYSFVDRFGTFVYKGATFAAVGFAAGLVGTAIANGLITTRKKMDPNFETPNKPPPTVLNALTWAIQLGLSSNLRYQTLNGVEFLLAKGLPPLGFKVFVTVLRCLNNALGGVSFVALARLTGSQKIEKGKVITMEINGGEGEEFSQSSQSHL